MRRQLLQSLSQQQLLDYQKRLRRKIKDMRQFKMELARETSYLSQRYHQLSRRKTQMFIQKQIQQKQSTLVRLYNQGVHNIASLLHKKAEVSQEEVKSAPQQEQKQQGEGEKSKRREFSFRPREGEFNFNDIYHQGRKVIETVRRRIKIFDQREVKLNKSNYIYEREDQNKQEQDQQRKEQPFVRGGKQKQGLYYSVQYRNQQEEGEKQQKKQEKQSQQLGKQNQQINGSLQHRYPQQKQGEQEQKVGGNQKLENERIVKQQQKNSKNQENTEINRQQMQQNSQQQQDTKIDQKQKQYRSKQQNELIMQIKPQNKQSD